MPKRLIIGILSGLIVAVILFLIFGNRGRDLQKSSIAEAVPGNAVLFIDKIDFKYFSEEFPEENILWRELVKLRSFSKQDSLYRCYFNFFEELSALEESVIKDGFGLSLHNLGKNTLAPMIYFAINEDLTGEEVGVLFNTSFHSNYNLTHRNYDGETLWVITDNIENETIASYTLKNGILIFSISTILVEDAIRTINFDGGFSTISGFEEIEATAGKYVQGNLYVNFKNISKLFSPILETGVLAEIDYLSAFGHLAEYDIDIDGEKVLLSGMAYSGDSSHTYLNIFRGQQPVKSEATSIIPAFASEFLTIAVSDVELLKQQFLQQLKLQGTFGVFKREDDRINDLLGSSPVDVLLELLSNEISWFKLDVNNSSDFHEVVIFELRSRSEAEEYFNEWIKILAKKHNIDEKNLRNQYHLDNQSTYHIYSFPEQLYDMKIVSKFLKTNFAFYDNYLIFSSSTEAIKRTIYQNVLHKTINNEQAFGQMNELVSTKSNITYYINPEIFFNSYKTSFNSNVTKYFTEWESLLRKIPGIVIQFSNEGELFYSNMSFKYSSSIKENALTVWESLLDSLVISKPALVRNHNTGEKEIMVQDASNALYLINSTGRILWKMRLENKVLSEIFQVDYYRNGKLQYLFNTGDAIHLIDRNGNYVERYPVKLRADATNGMSLFDYDNNSDYRIFVAAEDRKIYVYNMEGMLITGWDFGKTEGKVTTPVQHFRLGEKDYIVFFDDIRTYILNRRGKERVEINKQEVPSVNNQYFLSMNVESDNPLIIKTDAQGNVFGIDFNGNVHSLLNHEAGPEHLFVLDDLDQDGIPEYVFADENILKVYNSEGKLLFTFKIKGDISNMLGLYEFSSRDVKIGITDSANNQIFLLNADGTVYEGFPLEGNSSFSIGYFAGSDSRFNLIVGSSDSFIYNYSIE